MAKKSKVGTDVQQVRKQNQAASNQSQQGGAGQYQAEFGSETNAQQVRKQNQASASKQQGQNQASNQQGQYQAEFGSETSAQQVRKQNQKSQQKKGKNQQ